MILTEKTEIRKAALTPDGDSFKMRVPVLQADIENANKRRYPFAVVKAAVEELRAKLQKRTTFGSTRHEDQLELDAVSHVIEDISLDEKGLATAIIRIFGTQRGKNLAAILNGGGALGISARGAGDVKEGIVQAGYRLLGLDFVANPSFDFHVGKEAMVFESREVEEDDGTVTLETLREFGLIENGPAAEETLRGRYQFALAAGCRLTFEQWQEGLGR